MDKQKSEEAQTSLGSSDKSTAHKPFKKERQKKHSNYDNNNKNKKDGRIYNGRGGFGRGPRKIVRYEEVGETSSSNENQQHDTNHQQQHNLDVQQQQQQQQDNHTLETPSALPQNIQKIIPKDERGNFDETSKSKTNTKKKHQQWKKQKQQYSENYHQKQNKQDNEVENEKHMSNQEDYKKSSSRYPDVKNEDSTNDGSKKRTKIKKKFASTKFEQQGAFSRKSTKSSQSEVSHLAEPPSPPSSPVFSSLREQLIHKLTKGTYECIICFDRVKRHVATWSCKTCHTVVHLYCLKQWVKNGENKMWKCPAGCQQLHTDIPNKYMCFCGKTQDPLDTPYLTPHSCGEECGRMRLNTSCKHPCTAHCHPGPCPPCTSTRTEKCHCGKESFKVGCSEIIEGRTCGKICGKTMTCGNHKCKEICHAGPCPPCEMKTIQRCFCGAEETERICSHTLFKSQGIPHTYSCNKICDKALSCGNHTCALPCHAGPCPPCPTSPEVIDTCPCGKKKLSTLPNANIVRTSCMDPIPNCNSVCDKFLPCGVHKCQKKCHSGLCGKDGHCTRIVPLHCRCLSTTIKAPCFFSYRDSGWQNFSDELKKKAENLMDEFESKYKIKSFPFICDSMCGKTKNCGRHKCRNICCPANKINGDPSGLHICHKTCGKKLSCRKHKCDYPCHSGPCPPCGITIREPLACKCGKTVLESPFPCGTPLPPCPHECSIKRPCGHAANHNCHEDGNCPPCIAHVSKMCVGGHKLIQRIQCCLKEVSCSSPCGKTLICGKHKCMKTCHSGDCLKPSPTQINTTKIGYNSSITTSSLSPNSCGNVCNLKLSCGHPCQQTCHPDKDCDASMCKQKVQIFCSCKRRSDSVDCCYLRLKIQQTHPEIVYGIGSIPPLMECDKDCKILERNRKLAEALQIDVKKLDLPLYPKSLINKAQKRLSLIQEIETAFAKLVENKQEKNHLFPPISRYRRETVHELAPFWGLDSVSVDREPYRSALVTKNSSSQKPKYLLSEIIADPQKLKLLEQKLKEEEEKYDQYLKKKSSEPGDDGDDDDNDDDGSDDDDNNDNEPRFEEESDDLQEKEAIPNEEWGEGLALPTDSPVFANDFNEAMIDKVQEMRLKQKMESGKTDAQTKNFWSSLSS